MPVIKINNLDVEFGNDKISNFIVMLEQGDSLTLVGNENSGRQALVEGLIGFAPILSGTIEVDDEKIQSLPSSKRKIVRISSDWALFPHLSVEDNVGFGLRFKKMKSAQQLEQREKILKLFGLLEVSKQFCTQLNDLEKFKVAFARVAAIDPYLVILDEAFSGFDVKTRLEYIKVVSELQLKAGLTMLYSTSSPTDFMGISKYTAVLAKGYLEQLDLTQRVYENPCSILSAKATGEINCIKAQVVMGGDFTMFSSKLGGLNLRVNKNLRVESEAEILIRPEHTRIVALGKTEDARNVFSGKIQSIQFMSGFRYVLVKTEDDEPFLSVQNTDQSFEINDEIDVILTRDEYPIMTR